MARRDERGRLSWRETLTQLREPRYRALSALMVVVALGCIGAGTWEISRFDWKVHANDALTANAHDAAAPLDTVLPLVGSRAPSADAVQFRTVTATGRFDTGGQSLVRLADVTSNTGFYVLTPFLTRTATLLVVRGFVNTTASGGAPASVAAPPAGTVTIRARAQTGDSSNDRPAGIPRGQVASINPKLQSARSGRPTYDGYAQLLSHQPGTAGLTAIPPPDLSNPAGGAVEPQHFAYIIQWYLFAALALAAPFAMARADRREQLRDDDAVQASLPRNSGTPTEPADVLTEPADVLTEPADVLTEPAMTEAERRAAKLADRYGRPVR